MKYFSIDYRSPPSGIGQIVDPESDELILISCSGNGMKNDPNYSHTIHLDNPEVEETGWIGPIIPLLHQILKSHGITKVYDSEEGYERPDKCDSKLHFSLEDWIIILKSYS